jgi:hypothetical protein
VSCCRMGRDHGHKNRSLNGSEDGFMEWCYPVGRGHAVKEKLWMK